MVPTTTWPGSTPSLAPARRSIGRGASRTAATRSARALDRLVGVVHVRDRSLSRPATSGRAGRRAAPGPPWWFPRPRTSGRSCASLRGAARAGRRGRRVRRHGRHRGAQGRPRGARGRDRGRVRPARRHARTGRRRTPSWSRARSRSTTSTRSSGRELSRDGAGRWPGWRSRTRPPPGGRRQRRRGIFFVSIEELDGLRIARLRVSLGREP